MRPLRLAHALALCAVLLAPTGAAAQEGPAQPEVPKTSDREMLDRARVLKRPVYPDAARDDAAAGTVAVRVLVSPDGEVISARAVSGPEALRSAAAEAARHWEFASTEAPDNESGYLLFRFAAAKEYASIVGVADEEVAAAPEPTAVAPPAPKPAPAPAAVPAVQRVAAGDLLAKARRKVAPQYPPTARASRVEGLVVVELEVDETGRVVSARPVSGHALLRDAAVAAARQWTFAPTSVGGAPVKVVGTLSFNFKL
jgi:TonB family protein